MLGKQVSHLCLFVNCSTELLINISDLRIIQLGHRVEEKMSSERIKTVIESSKKWYQWTPEDNIENMMTLINSVPGNVVEVLEENEDRILVDQIQNWLVTGVWGWQKSGILIIILNDPLGESSG